MPLLSSSSYRAPWFLRNGHLMSMWPQCLRTDPEVAYTREALDLADGDVLQLDWCRGGSRRLVIVSHGLEGHSRRPYVLGMVRHFRDHGWDALAWNFRGCGGEPNRLPRFTTNASTGDLEAVVQHAASLKQYDHVVLVGFSMGGNLTLLTLGTRESQLPDCVSGAITLSVPADLAGAAKRLSRPSNRLYMKRFLSLLQRKLEMLAERHPGVITLNGYEDIRDFRDFDDRYTAPLHGFRDAAHYWQEGSSAPHLHAIRRPSLCINAWDDPFLPPACYPRGQARDSEIFTLEIPRHGGHCGFVTLGSGAYWSEQRAHVFAEGLCR